MAKKYVCIVSEELAGFNRSGGIGTCVRGLSEYLHRLGYRVDVIVTDLNFKYDGSQANKYGINIIPISDIIDDDSVVDTIATFSALSLYIYRYVKRCDYDIIHFNDWRGSGFHTAAAKRQGLIKSIVLCNLHGGSEWVREYNQTIPGLDDFELEAMEKKQIENSDIVIAPSQYLLDYYFNKGVKIKKYEIINWIIPQWLSKGATTSEPLHTRQIDKSYAENIIFVGRQERRKGLELFIDAVLKLPADTQPNLKFVGSFSTLNGEFTGSYILRKLKNYNGAIEFLPNVQQQELFYLLSQIDKSICVMPSLIENSPCLIGECFTASIPFISCDVGGIAELFDEGSSSICLAAPVADDLAEVLTNVIKNGLATVRSRLVPRDIMLRWAHFHENLIHSEIRNHRICSAYINPKVSVCLVHHERPSLLRQAIKFINNQTYKNIEIIVVDDGSSDMESQSCLEQLENSNNPLPLHIIRSENKYLGAARNLAAAHASGEYLIFHDDDNYLEPECIEIFVKAIVESDHDVLTSQYYTFSESPDQNYNENQSITFVHIGIGGIFSFFSNRFGDANAIVRKTTFLTVGGFSEQRKIGFEDWEFFLKTYLCGYKIGNIPEPLFNYRISANGMLMTGNVLHDYNRIFDFLSNMGVQVTSDLLRFAVRDELQSHLKSRVIQNLAGEKSKQILEEINCLPLNSTEQASRLAEYALSIGRAFDGMNILRHNRATLGAREHSVDYFIALNTLGHRQVSMIQTDSNGNSGKYFMICGWMLDAPDAEGKSPNFYIDDDRFEIVAMVRRLRTDVAEHLGLQGEGDHLGFMALVKKSINKWHDFCYFEKKTKMGADRRLDNRKFYISQSAAIARGHIDFAYEVQLVDLLRYGGDYPMLIEVQYPSIYPVACIIRDSSVVDFGYELGAGRSVFSFWYGLLSGDKLVVPVEADIKLITSRSSPLFL